MVSWYQYTPRQSHLKKDLKKFIREYTPSIIYVKDTKRRYEQSIQEDFFVVVHEQEWLVSEDDYMELH